MLNRTEFAGPSQSRTQMLECAPEFGSKSIELPHNRYAGCIRLPSLGFLIQAISRTRPPRLQSDVGMRLEMLGKMWLTSLMLFVAAMHTYVSGQCPTPSEINGGNGEFQSPNFGGEYGKKADCTWRFSFNSWTKYALKLVVKELRLYLIQNGGKVCVHGSYNLSINGELLECDKFAKESSGVTFCHAYYNDETCESLSDVTGCEVSRETEFPIDVKYNADGRTVSNDPALIMHGFKIAYKWIQCPDVSTTTQPQTTTLPATTTVEDTPTVPGAVDDVSMVHGDATPESTAYGKTTTTPSPAPEAGFPLPLVVGTAGGGAIILLLIIIVIIVCKKRRASSKSKLDQETGPTAHSSEIQMEKLEETDTEESVAHTVISGSNENSTGNTRDESSPASHDANENLKRDNKTGSPTTKQDSAISNDIYATPKKSKGKKLAAKNSANSTNQQPELTFEPESAYAIMTGNSPVKVPAQNSGHKEDSAYSVVEVKQKPQDIYAVPTKGKKNQSSNEPEQDSTYTEINHAHKKKPKTSAGQTKGVKQKPQDIYAVPVKSKKHQSSIEPEQDSTYTEINHAHKKKPKTSAGQTKGVKQKPQDIYAVPAKSKKHQSSNEPEQDSTYTEISHTPKRTPQISSTGQNSNEGSDIYTAIQKNPAKKSPLLHHTQKQKDDHKATEQSGDVYAAVEHSSGAKKTIHYEKEMKDNELYVAAP